MAGAVVKAVRGSPGTVPWCDERPVERLHPRGYRTVMAMPSRIESTPVTMYFPERPHSAFSLLSSSLVVTPSAAFAIRSRMTFARMELAVMTEKTAIAKQANPRSLIGPHLIRGPVMYAGDADRPMLG